MGSPLGPLMANAFMCSIEEKLEERNLMPSSGVASVDNWRGEYSYIRVHKPLKQSISKEINSAEHDI